MERLILPGALAAGGNVVPSLSTLASSELFRYLITDDETFTVDRDTGVVRLAQQLDYELKNLYRLPIRAKDNGTEPLRATCELVVSTCVLVTLVRLKLLPTSCPTSSKFDKLI